MVKIKKAANFIERFLHGEKGQRFFNFAYSIGAAIVIWGALFKILHLPGGSTLLCIGMGTEIAMFILTAFDRPPKEYQWENVFPILESGNADDRPDFAGGMGGSVVINGGMPITVDQPSQEHYHDIPVDESGEGESVAPEAADSQQGVTSNATVSLHTGAQPTHVQYAPASEVPVVEGVAQATEEYLTQLSGISEQLAALRETTQSLNEVSAVLLESYRAVTDNSASISESSTGYVERMADLNRNIAGLNTIYEIQLKSISSQLESIDRVNRGLKDIRDMYEKSAAESSRYCEETEKMARYMKQLNQVYEKMITAMTINMYNPMMGGAAAGQPQNPADSQDVNPFANQ